MGIKTAQQKIIDALPNMRIDILDDAQAIKPVGNLLVFEGGDPSNHVLKTYVFGLYIAKKVLNKNTTVIYDDIDNVVKNIEEASRTPVPDDAIRMTSITQAGFENGVLEYRCEIVVTEEEIACSA